MSKKISSKKLTKVVKEDIYKKHWKGMPEFNQPNQKACKTLLVNFLTLEDMHKFSKLVGQKLLKTTRSIWYPPVSNVPLMNKRWTDKKTKKKK